MRHPLIRLGPVLWALCACLFLLPRAAAAGDPSLTIVVDGDDFRDSVRLSAVPGTPLLVSYRPLHRIQATDLDGDGSDFGPPELTRTPPAAAPAHVSIARASQGEPARQVSSAAEPFSPRPPPA